MVNEYTKTEPRIFSEKNLFFQEKVLGTLCSYMKKNEPGAISYLIHKCYLKID